LQLLHVQLAHVDDGQFLQHLNFYSTALWPGAKTMT
jgi:hypothetical protein